MTLKGKVALVTGAGRGIGEGISLCLAKYDAKIAVTDIDLSAAESVAAEIKAQGKEAIAVKLDVTSIDSIKEAVDLILREYGRIDILVNNAGISCRTKVDKITEEEWDRAVAINLKGAVFCSQAVLESMKRQKYGRIISISSMAGLAGSENEGPAYCATKAAMVGLTKSISRCYIYNGITANTIAPGPIASRLTAGEDVQKLYKELVDSMPLKKLGKPENIGEIVAFLSTEESEFITGATIEATGGELIIV